MNGIRPVIAIASIFAEALSPTFAGTPGFSFKGLEVGEKQDIAQVEKLIGSKCTVVREGGRNCIGDTTIADQPAKIIVQLDRDDVVLTIGLMTDPKSFETISETLVARFGKPLTSRSWPLKNALGASFQQDRLMWIDKPSRRYMSFSRYTDKITESMLIFSTFKSDEEQQGELQKRNSDL